MLFAPAPAYSVIFTKEFLTKLPVCLTAFTTHSFEHELLFCRFEDKVFYIDTSVVYYPSATFTFPLESPPCSLRFHLSILQLSNGITTTDSMSGVAPDFYFIRNWYSVVKGCDTMTINLVSQL